MNLSDVSVLFVVAHPDDLEIGAGGTAAKLVSSGAKVLVIIVAAESDSAVAEVRRGEAIGAAAALGIAPEQIVFLGLPDGFVSCTRDSVALVRRVLAERGFTPSLVISHVPNDSHNDHRAVSEIARSSVRRCAVLGFPIVNSLEHSHFRPSVFVDIAAYAVAKRAALEKHASQDKAGRILWAEMDKMETELAAHRGLERAEAFELLVQAGGERTLDIVERINECAFSRFWHSHLQGAPLFVIHAIPPPLRHYCGVWSPMGDRPGVTILREQGHRLLGERLQIREAASDQQTVGNLLTKEHVLLSGGAVSNAVTREHFNHYRGARYVIDYEMPGYRNIMIVDRVTGRHTEARYEQDAHGVTLPVLDYGILTIMRNPDAGDSKLWVFGAMGIHGFATRSIYEILSSPKRIRELLDVTKHSAESNGCQIIVRVDVRSEQSHLEVETLHQIEPDGTHPPIERSSRERSTRIALTPAGSMVNGKGLS
jgi:LmbE family N-acetylglucosaminyl deacetylase